ncbi:MAG: endolytic transglycosylase MltG, partial [Gammaproteobacteria bacterium]|nr:endolytic transglycosylase MltG [Gammaproteobacteria bacterium]
MSRLLKAVAAIGLIACLAAAIAVFEFSRFLAAPLAVAEDGADIEIRPGMAFGQVSDMLGEQGIVSYPTLFRLYARFSGKAGSIHAGEYRIPSGTTPGELLDRFVAGDVRLYS